MWYDDIDYTPPKRRFSRRSYRRGRRTLTVRLNTRADRHAKARTVVAAFVLLITLAAIVGGGYIGVARAHQYLFSENPDFIITRFDVRTDGQLPREYLLRRAKLERGMNLFALDLDSVQRALQEISTVKRAEVQRVLPDTLAVRIVERAAIAKLGPGSRLCIDSEGCVLGPKSITDTMPVIAGYSTRGLLPGQTLSDARIVDALTVLDVCQSTPVGQVVVPASVDVGPRDYLDLRLQDGARIRFGRSEIRWRLVRLEEILRNALKLNKTVATVDMTVNANFPVTYRR